MSGEPLERHNSDAVRLSPMGVARHPLFTAREKLEMLEEMRGGFSVHADTEGPVFDRDEIEDAMAEVRDRAHNGLGTAAAVLQADAR